MTTTSAFKFGGAAVICAVLLAGCVSGGPSDSGSTGPGPAPVAKSPVEGEWVGTDGVAISSLTAGKFSSRSAATGETLTTGTYTFRSGNIIDLDFYSVKSQQSTRATCALVSQGQMNCTLASGTQFILTRRVA